MLSTTFHPRINFQALYIVEPMILSPTLWKRENFLEKGAVSRRDIWPSKEDAYAALKQRVPWKDWDER